MSRVTGPAEAALLARLQKAPDPTLRGVAAPEERQPVHVVYGGAHRFRADSSQKFGRIARDAMDRFVPDAAHFLRFFDMPPELSERVRTRVLQKLETEAIEAFRIDFEDGFGHRSDAEEDKEATRAAFAVAEGMKQGSLPPFLGMRPKSFHEPSLARRGFRTLERFFMELFEATGGALPPGFVVTLAKVEQPDELKAVAEALSALEAEAKLPNGQIRLEMMAESARALVGPDGRFAATDYLRAAGGRLLGVHLGPYDFSAEFGVLAACQSLEHPVCQMARQLMQLSFAKTGVWLSDGPVSIMPIAPHPEAGASARELEANEAVMRLAWQTHYRAVRRALSEGIFCGWDLHPGQLVSRYAAVYAFYLEHEAEASQRLQHFVAQLGQATRVGHLFDDAATGQGLLNFFLQAVNSGAMTEAEAVKATGLDLDVLRSRSFQTMVTALDAKP